MLLRRPVYFFDFFLSVWGREVIIGSPHAILQERDKTKMFGCKFAGYIGAGTVYANNQPLRKTPGKTVTK